MGPAIIINLTGTFVFYWVMLVNPFFSKVVRIQNERGHRLIDRGPYAFVRHPGYTGFIVQWFAVPIILESWWH